MPKPVTIAMWSGPRNISTAMMRAFGNRADCLVSDEPLYGPYLHATGKPHPGADEVIADQGSDWRAVVKHITGPVPGGRAVWYQKHMTHHILPGMTLEWLGALANCFLIRDPAEVLSSYRERRGGFDAADLGFPQQLELFEHVRGRTGAIPPVVDSRDVLEDPRATLGALCEAVGLGFDDNMLSWPAGARDSDGVWGKYWYDAVWASTGFAPYRPRKSDLDAGQKRIVEACRPCYETLYPHRLRAG